MKHQSPPSDKTSTPERIPPGQQLVAEGKWPYVGERLPTNSERDWSLTVAGLVAMPAVFTLEQLASLAQTAIVTDIHCVTRWSKLDARFRGVLLETVLEQCGVLPEARFVSFVARSDRRHSSSLPLQEAMELGTLLATCFDDGPLGTDHGGPLRGIVPRKYFYKSVKWLERIELLEKDHPGFWESDSGYHNRADPWLEQRYVVGSVSKREAESLIRSKDFSGRDLLSINLESRELPGLIAVNATLRNANFSGCNLEQANFRGANLSNANFRHANLRNANLGGADLEGADFASADLRSANLAGCSLFGTTFCDASPDSIDNAAKLDRDTKIDGDSLDALTAHQQAFMRRLDF